MKKHMKLILLISLMFLLVGCTNRAGIEAKKDGLEYMEKGEYESALESFKFAINEGLEDKEVDKLIVIIEDYEILDKNLTEGDFSQFNKVYQELDPIYLDYNIKSNIENLVNEKEELENIIENYHKVLNLVDENQMDDAKLLLSETNNDYMQLRNIKKVNKERINAFNYIEDREEEIRIAEEKAKIEAARLLKKNIDMDKIKSPEEVITKLNEENKYPDDYEYLYVEGEDINVYGEVWYLVNMVQLFGHNKVTDIFVNAKTLEIKDYYEFR